MMIPIEKSTFPMDYLLETVDQVESIPEFNLTTALRDPIALSLKVTNRNFQAWIANFGNGDFGGGYQYHATPNPDIFCAIINGVGYWVDTIHPEKWQEMELLPVKRVIAIPSREMILFHDYTDMMAYGTNGVLWTVNRLSADGIEILEIENDRIVTRVWDPPVEKIQAIDFNGRRINHM